MKNKIFYILFALLSVSFAFTSCTDYLERDSDSVLSEEDAFKNFNNFQGFIEVMYNVIPDLAKHYWVSSFNWGDDEVITTGNGEYLMARETVSWIEVGRWTVTVLPNPFGEVAGMLSVRPILVLRLYRMVC